MPSTLTSYIQVYNNSDVGVAGLTVDNFKYVLNETTLASSNITVQNTSSINTTIRTVIIVGLGTSSQGDLTAVKNAIISFAKNKASNQEVSIGFFNSTEYYQSNFFSDENQIIEYANYIDNGASMSNWGEIFEFFAPTLAETFTDDKIITTSLILITDPKGGGVYMNSQSRNTVIKKASFIVDIGSRSAQEQLSQVGKYNYSASYSAVADVLTGIQAEILTAASGIYQIKHSLASVFSNSFYVGITIKDNNCKLDKESDFYLDYSLTCAINATFNSANMYVPIGDIPTKALAVLPVHGSVGITTGKITWSCTDTEDENLIYDIYYGTSDNPSRKVSGHEEQTFEFNISSNRTYYWKIRAIDSDGNYSFSDIFTFTTVGNLPPQTPYQPSPLSDATGVTESVYLYWYCSDLDNDALTYEIYFGTDENPPLYTEVYYRGYTVPSFLTEPGARYY